MVTSGRSQRPERRLCPPACMVGARLRPAQRQATVGLSTAELIFGTGPQRLPWRHRARSGADLSTLHEPWGGAVVAYDHGLVVAVSSSRRVRAPTYGLFCQE